MLYLSLLLITLFCNGFAADIMRAIFTDADSGVHGNVTVQDSRIVLSLDLSTILGSNLPAGCDPDQGFLYHVYSSWTHSTITNSYGINCNQTFVGQHYDPYGSCSTESANPGCENNNGCINTTYSCSSTTYDESAYTCEVGDWSGKYGTLFLTDGNLTADVQSFGDVTGNQLVGKSIVFRCANNNEAAFCAEFSSLPGLVFGTTQRQSNGYSLKADFSSALGIASNKNAFILMDYTGQVQIRFDQGVFQNLVTPCSSNLYKVWIGDSWMSTNMAEVSCTSSVYGTFYDPTHQCYADANATDSQFCSQGKLCDESYTYSCDFTTDPFSCSPSDFSGRYGYVNATAVNSKGVIRSILDRYLGDLSDLPHKSLVLLCSANNLPVACAKLQNIGVGTAAASFSQNAQGFVRAKDGEITVSVSLNKTQTLYVGDILPADCFDNGVSIHIHEKWEYSDNNDRVGPTDCGSTYTGGHWDPWAACGPATGNSAVCISPTPTPSPSPACVQKTYKCNTTNYMANPFACEVGDWSGKYGVYEVTGSTYDVSRANHSYLEVDASALIGRSVVIHCTSSGGTRALCAPFLLQQGIHDGEDTAPKYSLKTETGNLMYNASVVLNSTTGSIYLKNTGAYYVDFDLTGDTQCSSTISYGVFNDAECQQLYDPTVQCPPKSEYTGTLCTDGKTCGATSEYNCQFLTDQYTCSPSDLSGRYGMIGTDKKVASGGYDDLMVPLKQLRTRYFGLFCSDTLTVIECLPWDVQVQATEHPTTSPTPAPTALPTPPTKSPTNLPSTSPSKHPTKNPTDQPTLKPSPNPTLSPTNPTAGPTNLPSPQPTSAPTTRSPTMEPTLTPTITNITVTILNITEEPDPNQTITTQPAAKSVNRIAIGVGMWVTLLSLF